MILWLACATGHICAKSSGRGALRKKMPHLTAELIDPERVRMIQDRLLAWFQSNARDLPWRRTRDPYAILVSEVMLQQTQVDRVLPYYERFLRTFPDVESLASAATADVIRLWSGLGYNRRAVNLQRAARAVVELFGGQFPAEPARLRELPGVGAYTAGAIAAFSFERDVAFLDTNMRRVVSRLLFGDRTVSERELASIAERLVPPGRSWEWNQALIEFGALQCTARRPACVVCPLQDHCAAFPTMQSTLAAKRARPDRGQVKRFETTSRYFRGRIVETLRGLPAGENSGIGLHELGAIVREGYSADDAPWLRNLIEGLQQDGLAVIAEETPPYDTEPEKATVRTRVRLP
jgi:A/G-specific adenine glycosylase